MKDISVAITTYNEEENISICLASVFDWVKEIVLVDGSSTDKTVEIAKKYKANIIIVKNLPNFHFNKQKAIDNCKHKWILQLDADEVVSEELRQEIININEEEGINGYWMPRKNYFLGRFLNKGGQYPDYTLRLYKRGKGYLPCKSVHEQANVEGKTAYLKNPLLHYVYPDFNHYLKHFRLYTDFFASELRQEKMKINLFSLLDYMLMKPLWWFMMTFFRHKGFMDGIPGFVFSFFSALRFPVAFLKYWQKENNNDYSK